MPPLTGQQRNGLLTGIGQGNGDATALSLSADGGVLAFASTASDLVSGDANGVSDIFIYNRETDQINLASLSSDGVQANGAADTPALSADGRYVAFTAQATNLVLNDTNGYQDVFVRDLINGQTERVSLDTNGIQTNEDSYNPAISSTGRYVVFESDASNLVAGDTNRRRDIFLHDRHTGQTQRISVSSAGVEADGDSTLASISADGRFIAFESLAATLVSDDTNNMSDIFLYDRTTQSTRRVSVSGQGLEGNGPSTLPILSADGAFVAFRSHSDNLIGDDENDTWDIFVVALASGEVTLVSQASDGTQGNPTLLNPSVAPARPAISADGRYVVFQSDATTLTSANDEWTDIYLRDRLARQTHRLSIAANNAAANDHSFAPTMAQNARFVAFLSKASNLTPGSTPGYVGAFYLDREGPAVTSTPTATATPTVPQSPTATPTPTTTPTPRFGVSLPLVMSSRILPAPVLSAIGNAEQTNHFVVGWEIEDAVANETYVLQEASNADFSDARVVFQGDVPTWTATDKTPGTYYYRVKRCSRVNESAWSNSQAVEVYPLFVGLQLRWEGTVEFQGNTETSAGHFWEENLDELSGLDTVQSQGHQWFDPNPLGWENETWRSAYEVTSGRFISSTLAPDPALQWGHPWILPYDLSLSAVDILSIDGQPFTVSGPYSAATDFDQPLRYWRLVNRDRFLFWEDAGRQEFVEPGDVELWYEAGNSGLLLHQEITRRGHQNDQPTGDLGRYSLTLVASNAFPEAIATAP